MPSRRELTSQRRKISPRDSSGSSPLCLYVPPVGTLEFRKVPRVGQRRHMKCTARYAKRGDMVIRRPFGKEAMNSQDSISKHTPSFEEATESHALMAVVSQDQITPGRVVIEVTPAFTALTKGRRWQWTLASQSCAADCLHHRLPRHA